MRITVLGYSGSIQTEETTNTSLLVRSDEASILIDASGSPYQAMLRAGQNPDMLDALVLTHAHVDHIYAFPSLLHNLWMCKRIKPLTVIGNEHAIEKARQLYELFLFHTKSDLMEIRWEVQPVPVGDVLIETFPVFHRPKVPTNGFTFSTRESKFSYFPDSAAAPPYPACAFGSRLVIHEAGGLDANREALNRQGHSSGIQAASLARALSADQLVLVHLPPASVLQKEIWKEASLVFPDTILPAVNTTYDV